MLAAQGQSEEGIAQMRQGLAALRATGSMVSMSGHLAQLAKACGQVGQVDEGMHLLAEALAMVDTTGERHTEAELHRLQGRIAAGATDRPYHRSGSLLPASSRHCPPPAGQILGVAGPP